MELRIPEAFITFSILALRHRPGSLMCRQSQTHSPCSWKKVLWEHLLLSRSCLDSSLYHNWTRVSFPELIRLAGVGAVALPQGAILLPPMVDTGALPLPLFTSLQALCKIFIRHMFGSEHPDYKGLLRSKVLIRILIFAPSFYSCIGSYLFIKVIRNRE